MKNYLVTGGLLSSVESSNNKKYYVVMKIKPLIGRHIRIGCRIHVNQPQYGARTSQKSAKQTDSFLCNFWRQSVSGDKRLTFVGLEIRGLLGQNRGALVLK